MAGGGEGGKVIPGWSRFALLVYKKDALFRIDRFYFDDFWRLPKQLQRRFFACVCFLFLFVCLLVVVFCLFVCLFLGQKGACATACANKLLLLLLLLLLFLVR